jgi:hypothetical protein
MYTLAVQLQEDRICEPTHLTDGNSLLWTATAPHHSMLGNPFRIHSADTDSERNSVHATLNTASTSTNFIYTESYALLFKEPHGSNHLNSRQPLPHSRYLTRQHQQFRATKAMCIAVRESGIRCESRFREAIPISGFHTTYASSVRPVESYRALRRSFRNTFGQSTHRQQHLSGIFSSQARSKPKLMTIHTTHPARPART